MKKALLFLASFFLCVITMAQTNVSGGIYANTTWTKLNSPYIVTDTVVVFPGVTLTIEAGVVVKFADNKRLEIRQASLIAIGTPTDSITFTSNSGSPHPGSWSEIYLNRSKGSNFNLCNFHYANQAILSKSNPSSDTSALVVESNFVNNITGIYSNMGLLIVDSCNLNNNNMGVFSSDEIHIYNSAIASNQTGAHFNAYAILENCIIDSNIVSGIVLNTRNQIINCEIKNNGKGITDSVVNNFVGSENHITQNRIEQNTIGVDIRGTQEEVSCNRICNNSSYSLYYNVAFGNNGIFPNNYWCSTDSATIAATIYDGYDNINLGLVIFMPIDTSQCYLSTGITSIRNSNSEIRISPNPATDQLNISIDERLVGAQLNIYSITGALVQTELLSTVNRQLSTGSLSSGVYIAELRTKEGSVKKRWVKM